MEWITSNAELALKIIGGVTSAITAVVTWMASRTRLRARLKTDIEVLKALDAGHRQRPLVEARVHETIDRVYGATPVRYEYRYVIGTLGVLVASGFIWWSVSIFRDDATSNWWVFATGYGAMTGLYLLFWSLGLYDLDKSARGAEAPPEASKPSPPPSPIK